MRFRVLHFTRTFGAPAQNGYPVGTIEMPDRRIALMVCARNRPGDAITTGQLAEAIMLGPETFGEDFLRTVVEPLDTKGE